MMKLVLISLMVAAASAIGASPQYALPSLPLPKPSRIPVPSPTYSPQPGKHFQILRLENEAAPDGSSFHYAYDTENGISAQETGSLVGSGDNVGLGASGSFQWTSPEGVPVRIDYVADENGYHPSGDSLPTPPPVPAAILRALQYIAAHPEPQTSLPINQYYRANQ